MARKEKKVQPEQEVGGVVKEFHPDGSLTVELNDGTEAHSPAAVAQEVPAKFLKFNGEGKF